MKVLIRGLTWLFEGELFLIITDEEGWKNFIMLRILVLVDGCIFENEFWHSYFYDGQLCDDHEII